MTQLPGDAAGTPPGGGSGPGAVPAPERGVPTVPLSPGSALGPVAGADWHGVQWPGEQRLGGPVPAGFRDPVADPRLTGPAEAWLARPYQQLLRGPTHTWWRPLLSVLVAGAALFVLMLLFWGLTALLVVLAGHGSSMSDAAFDAWTTSPSGVLVTNLVLAALIPVAQLAVWGGHGWRPRWVSSVAGMLRWPWLLRCAGLAAVVMVVGNGALVALGGGFPVAAERQAAWYAVVVLLTTPLQAAGEEFFFRGWLSQSLGSWFARPAVGAVVGAVISGLAFAYAHGQQDPWLFGDRFAFALVASWLVWRTGGLEAAIAVHAVNNLVAFALAIAAGEISSMMDVTQASPLVVISDVVLLVVYVALVEWFSRRWSVQRLFRPPVRGW